jgi:rhamnosyltransferase
MIASITVTYYPDLAALQRQLDSVAEQVHTMVVVDNGSPAPVLAALRALCTKLGALLLPLPHNQGIGAAQNAGIAQARQQGAQWVLLLDQDSEATPQMVGTLHAALQAQPRAAAAGPSSIDQRTGTHSFFVTDPGQWPRRWQPEPGVPHAPIEVGFLIASGTLLRCAALGDTSPMRASWFIDHVDSEWCLRMRAQGWLLLGVSEAVLKHRLGDKVTRLWLLRWRQVAHHSPLRDYYMFRNSILLAREPYVPLRWKLYFLSRLVQFAGFFLPFAPERGQRLRMMATGILHGLQGRTGPQP